MNTTALRSYRIVPARAATAESDEPAQASARFDAASMGTPKPAPKRTLVHIGLDFGTNKSCLKALADGEEGLLSDEIIPTVVGYAKEGVVEGLLPGNGVMLFGQTALDHRQRVNLVAPMVDGVVKDRGAARDFVRHLRGRIGVEKGVELRAVIGVPANVSAESIQEVRVAATGLFDRVILAPEPFLAALGCREEHRLGDAGYVDPVRNSLFVDIGAGTTDVCLVQGYFPTPDEQVSFAFAGDKVDALLHEAIHRSYPECGLSVLQVRALKEAHAYAGPRKGSLMVDVMVGGKRRKIDIDAPLHAACEALVEKIMESVRELIAKAPSDSVADLLQNILLTGGGSRIRGLDKELQRRLEAEGYELPQVRLAGERYREFVANGALKAARAAREHQWQHLLQ